MTQSLKESKDQLADLKQGLRDREAHIKDMQDQISKAQSSAQNKDEQINTLTRRADQAKEQINALMEKISVLQASPKDDPKMKEDFKSLRLELQGRQEEIKSLTKQLSDKVKALESVHKENEELRKDLKAVRDQLASLKASITVIERTKTYGSGNEGYMVRQGKDTSTMLYEVSEQVKTTALKMDENTQAVNEYKAKYEAVLKELEEAKIMLGRCLNKVTFPSRIKESSGPLDSLWDGKI